jgi:hypothetical protein
LRYGTALIAKTFGYLPVKAYHAYTALFYAVGIAGVYLLIRVGTRSRRAAWLGAAATALLSPSFLFLKDMRQDSWMWMPLRLGVLVKYGEGPHMTALALIPLALAFTWLALEARRPAALAAAALFCAAVASNNFYGATALADGREHEICFRARHHLVDLDRSDRGHYLRAGYGPLGSRQTPADLGCIYDRLGRLFFAQRPRK